MAKEVKQWITINGKHVPIYDGESQQDAYNRTVAKDNEDTKERQIAKRTAEIAQLNPNGKEARDEVQAKKAWEYFKDMSPELLDKYEEQELLNKNYITSEINHRLEQSRAESIASATEIMNFFSSVMRGEVKDQFGLEAPLSERTRAAVELAKRQIDIPQKLANNEQPTIRIALDWGRGATAEVAPKTVRELMGGDMTEEEINGYEGNTSTD